MQRPVWGSRVQPLVNELGREKPLVEGTEKGCVGRWKRSREVQEDGPDKRPLGFQWGGAGMGFVWQSSGGGLRSEQEPRKWGRHTGIPCEFGCSLFRQCCCSFSVCVPDRSNTREFKRYGL